MTTNYLFAPTPESQLLPHFETNLKVWNGFTKILKWWLLGHTDQVYCLPVFIKHGLDYSISSTLSLTKICSLGFFNLNAPCPKSYDGRPQFLAPYCCDVWFSGRRFSGTFTAVKRERWSKMFELESATMQLLKKMGGMVEREETEATSTRIRKKNMNASVNEVTFSLWYPNNWWNLMTKRHKQKRVKPRDRKRWKKRLKKNRDGEETAVRWRQWVWDRCRSNLC